MDDSVFCKNCGTPITGEPTDDPARRKPCPRCGSLGRDFKMKASPGVFCVKGDDADLIHTASPERLLRVAQDLIEKGEFGIAVVLAHTACEISVERALSRPFKPKGIGLPGKPKVPNYNLVLCHT